MTTKSFRYAAFTLIELLIVIAIIAVLLSVIIPSLGRIKERSRRMICMNNIRMFFIAVNAYAANHKELLPTGGPGILNYDYTIALRPDIYDELNMESIVCPNLLKPFRNNSNYPAG